MTVEVSAPLVKELRELTGAGMMDCKRALQETGGDLEAAQRLLRERGVAQAGKRAGRETTEGKVGYRISDDHAVIVAVGCETEPVSNNDLFLRFAKGVLEAVDREGPDATAELEDERIALIAKLGENVVIRGAARMERSDGEVIAGYAHTPQNKIGVLVKTKGGSEDAARRLAMHIAASRPRFRSRADVPDEEIDEERAIFEKRPEVQSKPDQVRGQVLEGMLAKRFFADVVLEDQPWVYDPARTVKQALDEEGVEVVDFVRYAVAE